MNNFKLSLNPSHLAYTAFKKLKIKIPISFVIHTFIFIFLVPRLTRARASVLPFLPTPLLPIVHDFHLWDSRLAVLILNTRPYKLALFTVYAPSQLNDPSQDQKRKEKFWHQIYQLYNHYSSQYIPVLMGDFNARCTPNFTQALPDLFGSTIFAPDLDEDLYPTTNFFHLTDFLSSNELSVISTMRSRPPSLLVTFQDIVSHPPPPSSPTLGSYAVLDHVICRQEHRRFFRSIRSHPSISLPWHHRRFLLSASLRLPCFRSPRRPPPLPKLDFSFSSSKLFFQSSLLTQTDFPSIQTIDPPFEVYLDGSCPDQRSVSYSNLAGWGVYFATLNLDFFGPVDSLPFLVEGSNNAAELQGSLEAISYIISMPSFLPTFISILIPNMLSTFFRVYHYLQQTCNLPLLSWIIIPIFLASLLSLFTKLNPIPVFPIMNGLILTQTTESPVALPLVYILFSLLPYYTLFLQFPRSKLTLILSLLTLFLPFHPPHNNLFQHLHSLLANLIFQKLPLILPLSYKHFLSPKKDLPDLKFSVPH